MIYYNIFRLHPTLKPLLLTKKVVRDYACDLAAVHSQHLGAVIAVFPANAGRGEWVDAGAPPRYAYFRGKMVWGGSRVASVPRSSRRVRANPRNASFTAFADKAWADRLQRVFDGQQVL